MYEKIDEPVEVLAKFSQEKITPTFFKWRGKTYKIEKLNLVHKENLGGEKVYYFSVSDDVNFFRLALYTANMNWTLEELFFEG